MVSVGGAFAQSVGSIGGTVTDSLGAIIVGATVTLVDAEGKQKQVISNSKGEYNFASLAPGKYTVKAIAATFALYENTEVEVTSGEKNELFVILTVGGVDEIVDVTLDSQVSTDSDNNADSTVLKGKDLDALPDDPDELEAALQALAGAAAGPNGGQIYIDGFTGGQMPSKDQIREIRINSNPFSAEYERPGNGRIEILTRPGSDKWRGSLNGNFNDESLNSRNPFATNRASTQMRNFGGSISGPVKKGKSSFSVDMNHRSNDNNAIINALVLDPTFNIVSFRNDVRVPTKSLRINPRFDFAINDKNTAVLRYSFNRNTQQNQGLGETSLLTRAYDSTSREHEIRFTETMIINAKTVNETRFEYSDNNREQTGDNSIPAINVSSAFTGGGATIGNSFNKNRDWELNNFTSTSFGKNSQHSIKFGGKLSGVNLTNRSENNYAGTFSFNGFFLPPGATDACDADGDGVVSAIDQYRCKLNGTTGLYSYDPTQFSITTGNPELGVSQYEGALFLSDDWKYRPDLLISLGLRYENQTNISSQFNFAPRLGIAWSPGAGGARQPKFVFRGGAGIFYNRFGESNILNVERNNGINQLNLLVNANDPDPIRRAAAIALLAQPVFTLSGVTNVPTAAQIQTALPQSNSLRALSPVLQAPYTMQAAFSVERALNSKFTLATTFVTARSLHQIRTRNTNAPICPSLTDCTGAVRPDPTFGNINTYESSASSQMNQLKVNLRANISAKFSMFMNYSLGSMKSDADGGSPAYAYDLTGEYGRSSGDTRHSFTVFSNFQLPWGISLNPFVILSSARPFNITSGTDFNGDGSFNERPTFGALQSRCAELNLNASYCNIGGNDPLATIPRNYGVGHASYVVNLRTSKNFGFGKSAASRAAASGAGASGASGGDGGRMGGGGGGMMRGGGGGGGRGGFGGEGRKPYNLNVSINANNLFNTVNLGSPVGSLTSSRFGQSTSTGGGFGGFGGFGGGSSGANRKIELSMRFSW